jgi:predicted NBD/HSP70 family sugar kinase
MRFQPDRLLTRRMNPLAMKGFNAIEILELIRRHGCISRAKLAAVSRLSKPTISDQVDALIAKGLVIEAGSGSASSRGGKKPTLIDLNPHYGRILCADIGFDSIRFLSTDLKARILHQAQVPAHPDRRRNTVLSGVKKGLAGLLRKPTTEPPHVQMISIAVPGIVDVSRGSVLETSNFLGWHNLRLAEELTAEFDIPVHVDNDVNMAALAELSSSQHPPDDFALIRLTTGIGAGIVLGGKLHHGAHWAAGEIGHLVLDAAAGARLPSPRGYLESIVGADRISERLREIAERSGGRIAFDLKKRAAWAVLHAYSTRGNPEILKLYEEFVLHLGCAVANVAAAYDPAVIILLGQPFPLLLDRIREITSKLVPWPIEIRLSALGDDASLRGALAAGLTRAYERIVFSLQSEGLGDCALAHPDAPAAASTI